MRRIILIIFAALLALPLAAQSPGTIVLDPPDTSRGVPVMTAFYLYDPGRHALDLVVEGDFRDILALSQDYVKEAPLVFLLVSDISRFSRGDEAQRLRSAAMDAAMVAQNILIFCASEGFPTVPRGIMDTPKIREALNLTDSQHPMLNVPVSYVND